MTPEYLHYTECFRREVFKITCNNGILSSGAYVQLKTIQRCCIYNSLSLADFLSRVDNATEETHTFTIITLPDVMKTIDYYRSTRHLTKKYLSDSIEMDHSNFLKLYRKGQSVNMKVIYDISTVLDIAPSVFMHQCERLVLNEE